jgi:hypothetical protein
MPLTWAFLLVRLAVLGRIRTRDPLLRRYGRAVADQRHMWPDVQFFRLMMAGRGLGWPSVCLCWLPTWLPGTSLAALTFE